MFAILLINLVSVRFVYRSLGAEDYGIYNVVAGVVAIVGFVGTAMASSTQRFYSYAIGENDEQRQKEIFSASLIIFAAFSLFSIIISEGIGLWLINTKLVIPIERLCIAKWVFHFSVFSFALSLFSIPYSAAIIANENIGIYAAITFGECFLKFISALLLCFTHYDKLLLYGLALLIVQILIFLAYKIYATYHHKEMCCFIRLKDRSVFKSLITFSGWSLFGSAAGVLINQGNTFLVNIFFGPVINAARSISLQICNALVMFSSSFTTALRPPIVKNYAEENYNYVNKLFSFGNKFIFYAMLLVCVPLFFEIETVLKLWIQDFVPETVLFSKLIIIYSIIMVLHDPITTIIQASGTIKVYYIVTESFTILCMPMTFIAYRLGAPAFATFLIMCLAITCSHIARLVVLKRQYPSFNVHNYIFDFFLPALAIASALSVIVFLFCSFVHQSIFRLFCTIFITIFILAPLFYYFALNISEKRMLKGLICSFLHRLKL